jgi:hypothetical protein
MEATGVLWKPVWNLRAGRFTLLVGNPRHRKRVTRRTTDVSAAAWITPVVPPGVRPGRFVPPRALRPRRDLIAGSVVAQNLGFQLPGSETDEAISLW